MTKPTPHTPEHHQPAVYEIRIAGHLDARWSAELGTPDLTQAADGTTLLRQVMADQSALHGLLQRLSDLGLPLISVNRIAPSPQSGARD